MSQSARSECSLSLITIGQESCIGPIIGAGARKGFSVRGFLIGGHFLRSDVFRYFNFGFDFFFFFSVVRGTCSNFPRVFPILLFHSCLCPHALSHFPYIPYFVVDERFCRPDPSCTRLRASVTPRHAMPCSIVGSAGSRDGGFFGFAWPSSCVYSLL